MTPTEIEAMTPAELAVELGWTAKLAAESGWSGPQPFSERAGTFLTQCRDAIAHTARLYPVDAAEAPQSLANDIASGTDWNGPGHWGEDEWWDPAYRLAQALLASFTPEEP